jgi:hypothetical protein
MWPEVEQVPEQYTCEVDSCRPATKSAIIDVP